MSTGSSSTTGAARAGRLRQRGTGPAGRLGRTLRAERLGTAGLLLSVLAATAPLMVVAAVMPTTFGVMGIVGLPLLFVLLGVVLVLFSFGYAEMSWHVRNAGAFYAYIARGLGGTAGAGAAWVSLVSYSALQIGLYGMFGYEVSALSATYLHVAVSWWVPALAGVVVVGLLGWREVELNARLLGVLLLVEVTLVVVFDAVTIAGPGPEGLSPHAFDPGTLTGAGVGTSLCFCAAAFLGFEQAPVYSEETSRPRVVVARVMFLAVGCVAVFFALTSWALTVATGPSRIVGQARAQSAGLLFGLTDQSLGATFSDVLRVLFVTGIFASALSFHNVVARYAFAMGREGLLPDVFGRTWTGSGAPVTGSLLQSVVSLVVVAAFAMTDSRPVGDPRAPMLHLFAWMGNVGALGVMLLMAVASFAVIVFFARRGAARAQRWRLTGSALSGVALLAIVVRTVHDFRVLVGVGANSALTWVLPGIVGLAAVTGLLQGVILRLLRPDTHAGIGLVNPAQLPERAADGAGGTDG